MNLSSRDLRAVIALIDERNFTRAAERMHLSQSSFSALIQGVEESLGAKLFERSTRSVVLTPEGRLFEESARRVLADFDGMVENFRDHAQRRRGRVAMAALPSLAAGWLPGVLAEYRTRYPGIELALMDSLSEQCLAMLRAGQVDLALATAGDKDADLATEELCSDEFHLICRKDHPLARQKEIRLRDLAAHPFVHLSRNSSVRQYLEAAFHPVTMQTVLEVEHLATVTGMVQAGIGITVVPALTLFHFDHPDLAVRPVEIKGLRRRILLVRRKTDPLSSAAQALYDLMIEQKPLVRVPRSQRGRRRG
ncbi:LysR family transcriptional regulator [Ramlibacter sp. USB13]|uniref:LysR family transcriptional regulator n=1 Tax=Ramlibacter cellulosilyticus TaxID=2764187 RepID=A0A923SCX6_9BURK|nr:LysR family transcriptional regulator [Ramlibacter cellulosilyticus]MBC5781332.1 LysR family transcriptional regulator [Ramlibacter cellulosilyticus]